MFLGIEGDLRCSVFVKCERARGRVAPEDDLTKRGELFSKNLFHSDKFQECEEGDDHLDATGLGAEEISKIEGATAGDGSGNESDFVGDGVILIDNIPYFGGFADPIKDFVKSLEKIRDADGTKGGRFESLDRNRGASWEDALLLKLALVEFARGILVFFVLNELADQFPSWIGFVLILLGAWWLKIQRKQFAALDVDERCGHDKELPGQFEVEFDGGVDVREKLVGDQFERHIINVDLILANEEKQKIERPLEDFQTNFVIRLHEMTSDDSGFPPGKNKKIQVALGNW